MTEKTQIILTLIQILSFTFYVGYIWIKYGIQKSISDSWYRVNSNEKWMFTIFPCFIVGLLQCFNASINPLFFFSGAFLCFTGTATAFKSKNFIKTVHFVGAVGAIIFSVIALAGLGELWVGLLIALSILVLITRNNSIWWIEIISFYSIMVGLLQYYLTL